MARKKDYLNGPYYDKNGQKKLENNPIYCILFDSG